MNMSVSGNTGATAAAMYARFIQQDRAGLPGLGTVSFDQVLAQAYSRNTASGLLGRYGVSIGVESIPKDEQEIARRGKSGSLKDVMIPPGVVEKMKSDPALRAKVEGSIYHYVHVERPDFARTDQLYGIKTVGSSLVIHEDGTWTIWSASVTSLEEAEKGRKLEAEMHKRRAYGQRLLEPVGEGGAWPGITAQTMLMTSALPGYASFSPYMNSYDNLPLLQKITEARALQRYYTPSLMSTGGGFLL